MPADVFFDTNVLLYAIAENDPRSARAEALLAGGGMIGIQGLNEFVAVARRKLAMSWKDITEALDAIVVLCPSPISVTSELHREALRVAESYGYAIYDALVVAAALKAKCKTLYSEDFQHGQVLDGKLTIQNPFLEP
jgi:predicted nucleic acid-binding protein